MRFLAFIFLIGCASVSFVAMAVERRISPSSQTYLGSLGARWKLELYAHPRNLLVDGIMTDATFSKTILITSNRLVEKGKLNQLHIVAGGPLVHVMVNQQQLGLYFINYTSEEAREVLKTIQEDLHARLRPSLFFQSAYAESAPDAAKAGTTTSTTGRRQISVTKDHQYVLGEEFPGCAKGVILSLNSLARYPWDVTVQAAEGGVRAVRTLKSLNDDPEAFWQRSKEEFADISTALQNFKKSLGNQWHSFLRQPAYKQSETLCKYFAPTTAMAKAAIAAGSIGTLATLGNAEASLSARLGTVDSSIAADLYAIPRGTRKQAAAKNQEVLDWLKTHNPEVTNPKRVAGLSDAQIKALYNKVATNPVAQVCSIKKYDPKNDGLGFCFFRAMTAHLEALKTRLAKDQIRKVWAVGELNTGNDVWSYHVATIVKGADGDWWAIDPFLGAPVPVADYYKKMKSMDVQGDMRFYTTDAKRFGLSIKSYEPKAIHSPIFNNYARDLIDGFQAEAKALVGR